MIADPLHSWCHRMAVNFLRMAVRLEFNPPMRAANVRRPVAVFVGMLLHLEHARPLANRTNGIADLGILVLKSRHRI